MDGSGGGRAVADREAVMNSTAEVRERVSKGLPNKHKHALRSIIASSFAISYDYAFAVRAARSMDLKASRPIGKSGFVAVVFTGFG